MARIDQASFSRFMAGKVGMSLPTLDALADALGLDVVTNVGGGGKDGEAAGMKYLEGQQEAQAEAAREAARARRADDQPGADDELRAAAESAGSNGSGDPRRVG